MDATTLFRHWTEVRSGLLQALDKLADAQMSYVPREGLWSLGQTVCHLAGAEEGWFRYVVMRELKGWDEADFKAVDYPTVTVLKALLSEVHARTENLCLQGDGAFMRREVVLPWGPTITVEDVAWHVLEHEIHHRGEVYLMLGLMGMEAPDV